MIYENTLFYYYLLILNFFKMKNFQFVSVLVLLVICIAGVYTLTKKTARNVEEIEKTQLFLVSSQKTEDGKIKKYYSLQSRHSKVVADWINDDFGNPFINCRGLVFIGKKRGEMELFDCRKSPFEPVLTHQYLDKHGYVLVDMRPHYNDGSSVVIELRQKGVDGFLGKHLLSYDLNTKKLTSLLN